MKVTFVFRKTLQDQGSRIANLETMLANQQTMITSQAEKLKEWQTLADKWLQVTPSSSEMESP